VIISRTPYRISFFGGGTDYPAWFQQHGAAVLATTINRYCYITCRFLPPFFDHLSRVVWSKIEVVGSNSEIEHPVIREVARYLAIDDGVEVHHHGDLPARSGLGSSSAFTVGLLHAFRALQGEVVSKETLAKLAIRIEQDVLKENVGVQDQIQTAFGGLNRIDVMPNGSFHVRPIPLGAERLAELESHLLLFYTGVARNASDVAAAQIRAIADRSRELHEMRRLVDDAADVLSGKGSIADFGRLLHDSWELKRRLSDQIAPPFVDDIYRRAMEAGALGGKLLGAGGGGFMLFFVRPKHQARVLQALSELLLVPIQLDWSGSQLIFYDPPQYTRTSRKRRDYKRYIGGERESRSAKRPLEAVSVLRVIPKNGAARAARRA
jgi:D-glycero-alpha-D-manno-heptose-7-phosphate kinase